MNAIVFTPEVRAIFGAPRTMLFSAMLAAILSRRRASARLLRMRAGTVAKMTFLRMKPSW